MFNTQTLLTLLIAAGILLAITLTVWAIMAICDKRKKEGTPPDHADTENGVGTTEDIDDTDCYVDDIPSPSKEEDTDEANADDAANADDEANADDSAVVPAHECTEKGAKADAAAAASAAAKAEVKADRANDRLNDLERQERLAANAAEIKLTRAELAEAKEELASLEKAYLFSMEAKVVLFDAAIKAKEAFYEAQFAEKAAKAAYEAPSKAIIDAEMDLNKVMAEVANAPKNEAGEIPKELAEKQAAAQKAFAEAKEAAAPYKAAADKAAIAVVEAKKLLDQANADVVAMDQSVEDKKAKIEKLNKKIKALEKEIDELTA